jgi:hypothetical protein
MYGHVSSSVKPFVPYEIGEVNPHSIKDEKKTPKQLEKEEMERRMRQGFPRFRTLQPHEKKKEEPNEQVSLIQLAYKYKNNKNNKLKEQLNTCKSNCDTTCNRSSMLKSEGIETCILRCQLACTTNILNVLLK